jgi:putative exporter of polyketide antibiotics
MMTLTTPALLFPAISLLLLAYTNRFLTVAQVIRHLHERCSQGQCELHVAAQLTSLHQRVTLIKRMQIFGVISFLLCTLSMFALFIQQELAGEILFGISILMLSASLILSLYEVTLSTHALNLELEDLKSE